MMEHSARIWVLSCIVCVAVCEYACPAYSALRTPAVSADKLEIKKFSGFYYVLATTEPTLPPICSCLRINVTVHTPAADPWGHNAPGWYEYAATATCSGLPFTFHMKAYTQPRPRTPLTNTLAGRTEQLIYLTRIPPRERCSHESHSAALPGPSPPPPTCPAPNSQRGIDSVQT